MAGSAEPRDLGAGVGTRPARSPRSFFRRWLLPAFVIAAIAGAIWFLEYRQDGASYDPSGRRYGPVDLPASLAPADAAVEAEQGDFAPDFLLEQLSAGQVQLSDFRGHPVVLNFWATWCAPCRKEMPQFVDAYQRYKTDGLVLLAVDMQEGASIIQPFAQERGMNFPIALDRDGEVGDEYRLLGLPTTFFIDRGGLIRGVFTGPVEERTGDTNVQGAIEPGELEKRIAEIMTPAGAAGP